MWMSLYISVFRFYSLIPKLEIIAKVMFTIKVQLKNYFKISKALCLLGGIVGKAFALSVEGRWLESLSGQKSKTENQHLLFPSG